MSLMEQFEAGIAQATRPIPLPERGVAPMQLVAESTRIQTLFSRYLKAAGATPTGIDHSPFQIPGMSRDEATDLLTNGARRRDLAVANQVLLQNLADERSSSRPQAVVQETYTRWFNLSAVRTIARAASPTNTALLNGALSTLAETLLSAVAEATDPRVHEITSRIRRGTQHDDRFDHANQFAQQTTFTLLHSLMADPFIRPSEPPSRPSAA